MADLKVNSTMNGELLLTESSLPTFVRKWRLNSEAKITASDGQSNDFFGRDCSISNDGLTCIVTARLEDTVGSDAGAAYIYQYTGTWTEVQKIQASDAEANDWFGYSVSMSGDGLTCAVGALGEDEGGNNAGAAYIFENQSGTWTEVAKLVTSDASDGHNFANSLKLSNDGLTFISGSGSVDDNGTNAGAAYIFENQNGTWIEVQKIQSSDVQANDSFGESSSISGDGTVAVVSARLEDTGGTNVGAVYIFENQNGTWIEVQKIQASDAEANDWFSEKIEMSSDGLTIIVAARLEDTGGTNAGAAYIFENQNGTWVETAKIQASDKQSSDSFGRNVSISNNGLTCIVGADGEDTGGSGAGAAYIFENQNGNWIEVQKVQASDKQSSDGFGYSVAISGDGLTCVIGSRLEDSNGSDSGAAYVFRKY